MSAQPFYVAKSFCPFCKKEYGEYSLHLYRDHPISCENTCSSFDAYSSGSLDEKTDERVICHLSKCTACYDKLTLYIAAKIKERNKDKKKLKSL